MSKTRNQKKGRKAQKTGSSSERKSRSVSHSGNSLSSSSERKNKSARNGGDQAMSVPLARGVRSRPLRGAMNYRLNNREFIGTITGDVNLNTTRLSIQPGDHKMFPWLNCIARDFMEYRFHKLRIHYVTRSSATQLGSVAIAYEADLTSDVPSTEAQALNRTYATESNVWSDMTYPVPVKGMEWFLVRDGNVPGARKDYDIGYMDVTTIGVTGGPLDIGKIFVEYDVEFRFPATQTDEVAPSATTMSQFGQRLQQQLNTPNVYQVMPFDAPTHNGLEIISDATTTFSPPKGTYFITYRSQLRNSQTEATELSIGLLRNGVLEVPSVITVYRSNYTAPSDLIACYGSYILSINDGDTIAFVARYNGMTGIVNLIADSTNLTFTAV